MKSRWIYFLFVIAPVFFVIIGFEFYLRYTSPYIIKRQDRPLSGFLEQSSEFLIRQTPHGRRLIPGSHVVIKNHRLSRRDITIDINSSGFRGSEIPDQKKENEVRILVLGDSITFGDYLEENEIYVRRMEDYLKQSIKDKTIRVINGGVSDIGLKEEIDILIEHGISLKPDMVVVGFYLNDSRSPWGFQGEPGSRGYIRRYSLLAETIYKNLKFNKWIKEKGEDRFQWIHAVKSLNWAYDKKAFLELAHMAKYDWGASWEAESWDIIDRQLSRLKSLSIQYGFKTTIVFFPVAFQVYAEFLENTPQQILGEKVRNIGFRSLDLLPVLRKHEGKKLFFDHCHPRVIANDIIGKAIAQFLHDEVAKE